MTPAQPNASHEPPVEASGLTRRFGDLTAVDDVSLTVPRGAVFGLLGPDGAGKTTLLRMLATVLLPDGGDARVFGASVTREPEEVTPRIGYMSQQFCMYPDLTVKENIDFFATLRGVHRRDRRERAATLLTAMGMAEFTGRPAGRLSGGMKQKLMLTSTLMHHPDLLLLDEPTTGVDPVSRREFWNILADLQRAGTTVLVATPYMDEAERCTHIAFMSQGRITHTGTPEQVKALVPGTVLEVSAPAPRDALAACDGLPGVLSAHLLGDRVRLLVADGTPPDALASGLLAKGVGASVNVIEPDMEAAFAYLAEVGEAVGESSDSPAEVPR
jgi:ABC-2 type transport system ATP-binding protein